VPKLSFTTEKVEIVHVFEKIFNIPPLAVRPLDS